MQAFEKGQPLVQYRQPWQHQQAHQEDSCNVWHQEANLVSCKSALVCSFVPGVRHADRDREQDTRSHEHHHDTAICQGDKYQVGA